MSHSSEASSGVLSIDFDSDDLPICEPYKRLRDSSSEGSSSSWTLYAESDSGQEIELDSVTDLYPDVIEYLDSAACDVDQLVLHGYKVTSVVEDFSCDYFLLEPRVFHHRAFTEKASTRQRVTGFSLNTTDLFLGTLGGFQVIIEKITSERHCVCLFFFLTCAADHESESIRTHFVTELTSSKELYAGYVSKSPKPGIVVRKGCTLTVPVFLKLCLGCGVQYISLGRYGQKTPYKEWEKLYRDLFRKCQQVSIDMAFTFSLGDNTSFPLFCYASNPSRASLYFHKLGQRILNQKPVNYGMVR